MVYEAIILDKFTYAMNLDSKEKRFNDYALEYTIT